MSSRFEELQVSGIRLQLLPQRAVFLPEPAVLLVADAHIGKAVSFRKLGVPVPEATTAGTLQRLSDAVRTSGAVHVVFLGDLLHSASAWAADTLDALASWRQAHADVQLSLVRGNHDDHAGDPPQTLGVHCVDEPFRLPQLPQLALCHHPHPRPGCYVLAGHVHPAAVIQGHGRDALRLPAFHFGPEVGILPAFGEFTGTHTLPRGPADRVWVTTGDTVRRLPPSASAP